MVPPLSALSIMEPLSLPNQRELCKIEKSVLVPPYWKIAPKMCDFQQAINLHSRGPTEQCFRVWESQDEGAKCACTLKFVDCIGEGCESQNVAF